MRQRLLRRATIERRAVFWLGAAFATSGISAAAHAGRGVGAVGTLPDPALRRVQDQPELRLALPAFDAPRIALMRELFAGFPGLAAGAGTGGAAAAAPATHAAPHSTRLRLVADAFFRLSNPRITVADRERMLPDASLPDAFADFDFDGPEPNVTVRGGDVIDQMAYWLMVTVSVSLPPAAPIDEKAVFQGLRAQVLQAYARSSALSPLNEDERHDLIAWLALNHVFLALKMEFAGRGNANDGSSPAEAAIRSDVRAALRRFGLEPAGLRLDARGLSRA